MAPATIDALVTGATGFVGANVARELLRVGATVRVLARPHGDRRAIEGLKVEVCEGDLVDPASIRRAVQGARTVFHVAADYRLWARHPEEIYRANVEGTRAVLQAAADAGVTRIVHTSSVGALGIPKDGSPGTETTPVTLAARIFTVSGMRRPGVSPTYQAARNSSTRSRTWFQSSLPLRRFCSRS